jgi:NAD dependent epimerase/dehydratase family enzyme
VSPSPSRNAQFFHEVGKALHRPTWLPVPEWVLRPVLRDFATALCQGPQVTPKKLQENCFTWKYPELTDALQNIYPS